MIRTLGNVESFELCQMSHKIQRLQCMEYLMEGIIDCDCSTCLIPSEEAKRLNKERHDVLTISFFTINKGANLGARHGRSEDQLDGPKISAITRAP